MGKVEKKFHVSVGANCIETPKRVGKTSTIDNGKSTLKTVRVSWIRLRDFHVLTIGRYTYTTDQRFEAYHTDFSNDWALKIQNVQQKDEGLYECQLTSDNPVSQYVYLHVVVPLAKILEGRELFFKPGSSINITCFISNSPEPPVYVFWYHDERMINYDFIEGQITVRKAPRNTAFSSLYINDAQLSDSGNYTCAPSNSNPVSILVNVIKVLLRCDRLKKLKFDANISKEIYFDAYRVRVAQKRK
ncbi:uncharacterized protein LOC106478021 [Limulus polyphemus]|uniref:Uncharacterized protein LOC106478021 n=1 Tax=Limulus polyphemus TaxID=6850 RepID=A0ABM1C4H2_LIMPO|nr:uncharacterized protein LOC106478021 [Limulus polyphemus]